MLWNREVVAVTPEGIERWSTARGGLEISLRVSDSQVECKVVSDIKGRQAGLAKSLVGRAIVQRALHCPEARRCRRIDLCRADKRFRVVYTPLCLA